MSIDQGQQFGTWTDPTSRLIYHDAMPALLNRLNLDGRWVDLGGANGLMREWLPNLTTVDIDPTKAPDIVADIVDWTPGEQFDAAVCRYVLHYMDHPTVIDFLRHVGSWASRLLSIQIVNPRPADKYARSVNEKKYFRTRPHVELLYDMAGWTWEGSASLDYWVGPEFYRNRLGHPNPPPELHEETIILHDLRRPE